MDYGRYPAVSLRRQDWTSTSFGSFRPRLPLWSSGRVATATG